MEWKCIVQQKWLCSYKYNADYKSIRLHDNNDTSLCFKDVDYTHIRLVNQLTGQNEHRWYRYHIIKTFVIR